MDDSFETVRSLRAEFVVTRHTSDEIVLAVDAADISGVVTPASLRFSQPRRPWASRWDSVRNEWQDAPELSIPSRGSIREAFIKPIPAGIVLSFSDGQEPLVRWGFIADGLTVERSSASHRSPARA